MHSKQKVPNPVQATGARPGVYRLCSAATLDRIEEASTSSAHRGSEKLFGYVMTDAQGGRVESVKSHAYLLQTVLRQTHPEQGLITLVFRGIDGAGCDLLLLSIYLARFATPRSVPHRSNGSNIAFGYDNAS